MLLGLLFIVSVGGCWAVVGAIMSIVARERLDPVAVMGTQRLVQFAATAAFVPRYSALADGTATRTPALAAAIVSAGLLSCIGLLTLQRAMSLGHHAASWTVGQSALVVPFLAGAFLFGEAASPLRFAGLALILVSLAAFGMAKERRSADASAASASRARWLLVALSALLLLGLQQTLVTLPSHWARTDGWADVGRLRIPLLSLGGLLGFSALMVRRWRKPRAKELKLAFALTGVGVVSQLLFYSGLDALAAHGRVSIGYPVAVGTCIVGFAVYSLAVLKERTTGAHLAGLGSGVLGIVLIALR